MIGLDISLPNIVWIGVRESDIKNISDMFVASITIFGSGKNGNISMDSEYNRRFNHNQPIEEYDSFFQREMKKFIKSNKETVFLCYDALDCEKFDAELVSHIICFNSFALLKFFDSKFRQKRWAEGFVDVLPYKIINCKNALDNFDLKKSGKWVFQKDFSCGGNGTFLFENYLKASDNFFAYPDEKVIVTKFEQNNISVNIHAVIYQKEVVLFPLSIQLIDNKNYKLEYVGSDFSAAKCLKEDEYNSIVEAASAICKRMQDKGYLGICGIDFIIVDGKCYFMEVNARFQASSSLLNDFLLGNGFPSLQEYHMDSFYNNNCTLAFPPRFADGAQYIYHFNSKNCSKLLFTYNNLKTSNCFNVYDDDLSWNFVIDEGSYLFSIRSLGSISSITYQNDIRLYPDLKLCDFLINSSLTCRNLTNLKIALLSRGTRISFICRKMLDDLGGADIEEFSAITINLFDDFWITVPCNESQHEMSPFEITYDNDSFELKYYEKAVLPVKIMMKDTIGECKTCKGHLYKEIVYKSPDRLRIYHRDGCALQNAGVGCKFCDLFGSSESFHFVEICEALSAYFNCSGVRHFMIGGGSEIECNNCRNILMIAKYISSHTDKSIYVMSRPITDKEILLELKQNSVTEIAYNIEIFDEQIAKDVMPGKTKCSLEVYYKCLELATRVWGKKGQVRSMILLGFDDINTFNKGIEKLCSIGVAPMLSVFRPCTETPLENFASFDEETVMKYYNSAKRICAKYNMTLGPTCKACQNNTVVVDL